MKNFEWFFIAYVLWNVLVFFMTGIDKLKAKKNWYRISELTLLISSFMLGAVGLSCGMIAFHHKINKIKFKILVPISMVVNILLIYVLLFRVDLYCIEM